MIIGSGIKMANTKTRISKTLIFQNMHMFYGRKKSCKYRLNAIMMENQPEQNKPTPPLFYLSDYRYGGCTTFTAHLLRILNKKCVLCLTKAFERDTGDFGYGIKFQRKPIEFLDKVKEMFITDMYQNFHLLHKLKDKDVTIVVHDPGEVFKENEHYLKRWNIVVIRKTVQAYLKRKYGIKAKFLYHPFYQYEKFVDNNEDEHPDRNNKTGAISILRIEPHKNIDVMLRANKKIKKNPIKIYGFFNPSYVHSSLKKLDFDRHYHGTFDKSFSQVSAILSKSTFMVDLSEIPNDGG